MELDAISGVGFATAGVHLLLPVSVLQFCLHSE